MNTERISTPISVPAPAPVTRNAQPLSTSSPEARATLLRSAGMHAPNEAHRQCCDAFDIRSDVTVIDALETASDILRTVIASLDVLVCNDDMYDVHRDACNAALMLARYASGALGVVKTAFYPGSLQFVHDAEQAAGQAGPASAKKGGAA